METLFQSGIWDKALGLEPPWLRGHRDPIEESFVTFVVREYMQKFTEVLWSANQRLPILIDLLPAQEEPDAEVEIRSLEARIRQLIEKGNVSKARDELSAIPTGTSGLLDKWKRLLADAVVKQGRPATGQGMHSDLLWLQNHSAHFKGQWVALKRGQFLGSNPSSIALEAQLEELDLLAGATFFKVEE